MGWNSDDHHEDRVRIGVGRSIFQQDIMETASDSYHWMEIAFQSNV